MFLLHTKIMEHSSSYILVLSPNDAFLKIRQKRVQHHCISTSTRSSLNNVPNIMYVYYFEFSVSERKAHRGTFSFIRRFIRLGKKIIKVKEIYCSLNGIVLSSEAGIQLA